ncbi:hypothetical protein CCMSSC00406_0000037 [Pleurotus cornucopiae]|uniref:Uncharacterized protein n=1 Tax=Pleurotus cornucopiae TaxID=5321 RepID=A0ACB7IYF0_PLECO|nr:hypothetical protein CCMSSC00406_0000037 [Pleurotus cornucopiae]
MGKSLSLHLLLIAGTSFVLADPFNVTVDDKFGPFPQIGNTIHFGEGWFESGVDFCPSPGCHEGVFHQAFNQTWKRSIYQSQDPTDRPKVATFSFKGTAVYVNTITNVQTGAGVPGNSDMTFLLDDQVSYFISKAPGFPIAQTVFSATGLVDKYHNLTIVNGHPNSSFAQVMMFLDSIIYTWTEFLPLAGPTRSKDNAPSRPNIRLVIGVSSSQGESATITFRAGIRSKDILNAACRSLPSLQVPYTRPAGDLRRQRDGDSVTPNSSCLATSTGDHRQHSTSILQE